MERRVRVLVLLGTVLAARVCAGRAPGRTWYVTASGGASSASPPILTAWIINTTERTNPHWPGTPVDVQSVQEVSIGGVPYVQVHTNRIPDYYTTMTQALIQELNGRPRAAGDFRSGQTTASMGQVARFGDDIGYRYQPCVLGYWPPGPGCPTAQTRVPNIPEQPIRATQPISTALGVIGLWVNGTAVYNWSDGHSYNNGGVWWNNAPVLETYDMDI